MTAHAIVCFNFFKKSVNPGLFLPYNLEFLMVLVLQSKGVANPISAITLLHILRNALHFFVHLK